MSEETNPQGGVEEQSVNSAAGLIENLMDADFQIGDEPVEKKTPESKTDAPEDEDVDPEDETDEPEDSEGEDGEDPDVDPEDEEDEEPETDNLFTIKVNGKESQVTRDELVKGYQREADYTQKTQALSAERKDLETELGSVRAERVKYAEALQNMDQNADADLKKYQETDWESLKEEDPEEYRNQRDDFRELQNAKKEIAAEKQALIEKSQKEHNDQRMKIAKEQSSKLLEHFPAWKKDKAKAKTGMERISRYATEKIGYTVDQVNSILDHRHLLILDKARRYDAYMKADPSKNKLKKAGKFIAPGSTGKGKSATGSKATKISKAQIQKAAETGSVKDAAKAIESFL